jgi:glyoxylase-like metal-dependent hydrolase (beta-lactamase superfamily II)
MERTIGKNYKDYRRIDKSKLSVCETHESRKLLEGWGISGEVIVTDYHSPDSVSFLADTGEAVVGDLPPEAQGMPDDQPLIDCWDRLRGKGAKIILPGHGPIYEL